MPTRKHSIVQTFLIVALFQFLEEHPLGLAGVEWRCIFGPVGSQRTFVPDIMYVANERLTDDPYLRAAPDLAIEVLSPDQPARQFASKIQFYRDNGVRLVWVIDPEARAVDVYAPDEPSHTLGDADTLSGGAVLPGFSISLAGLFARM